LKKSKNLVLSDVFRSVDSPHQFPRVLTDLEIYFENQNALINYIEQVKSLSAKNIVEVANKYFQEDNYARAILAPKR